MSTTILLENLLASTVKGVIMILIMDNDDEIKGQYELVTENFKSVCMFTDRKPGYEYFPLKDIKSVQVEKDGKMTSYWTNAKVTL